MTETTLHNLKMVGTTSSAGGRFGDVRITGEAVLTGDTECGNMTCVGTVGIKGSLRANKLKWTGECKIEGNLQVSQISGIGEIGVSGSIRGDAIRLTGDIRAAGNCEAETLSVNGGLHVDGLVSADRIDVRVHGPSRAREIGGGTVTVKRSRAASFKNMLLSGTSADLSADLIEGDILHLEHTKASVVRGNRITLGPGCDIGRAEYRGELQVGKNSTVMERVKL